MYEIIRKFDLPVLVLLLALLPNSKVHSQTNLKEGYILKSETDTVFGFIDFKIDSKMSQFVDFYQPDMSGYTRYFPGQIFAYGLTELEQYVRREIIIDEIYGTRDSVFLRVLVKGRASLFVYYRNARERFYIHRDALDFMELSYQESIYREGVNSKNPHGKYLGILQYYFSDCSFYLSNPPDCNFNAEALSREVHLYNSRINSDSEPEKNSKMPGPIINIGFRGGMGVSTVDLSEYNKFPDIMGAEYNSVSGPFFGLFLEAKSKHRLKPLSLIFELNYVQRGSSTPDNYSFYYSPIEPDVSLYVNFDYAYIDGVIAAKYAYEIKRASIFLKAGLLYGMGLKKENIIVRSSKTEINRDNVFKTEYSNEMGVTLSVGSDYQITDNSALGLEFRLEQSNAIPASWNNPISNNSLIVAISYQYRIK